MTANRVYVCDGVRVSDRIVGGMSLTGKRREAEPTKSKPKNQHKHF